MLQVNRKSEDKPGRSAHGLTRNADRRRLIEGVTKGFRKSLELQGVGSIIASPGPATNLNFSLGGSHPGRLQGARGHRVRRRGHDQSARRAASTSSRLGQVAAEIRDLRPARAVQAVKACASEVAKTSARSWAKRARQGRSNGSSRVSRTVQQLKRCTAAFAKRSASGTEARLRLQIFRSLHHTLCAVRRRRAPRANTFVAASTREGAAADGSWSRAHQRRCRHTKIGCSKPSPSAPKPAALRPWCSRHVGSEVSRPRGRALPPPPEKRDWTFKHV